MTALSMGCFQGLTSVKLASCVKTDCLCRFPKAGSCILFVSLIGFVSKGDKILLLLFISVVLLLIIAWLFRGFLWRRISGRSSLLKLVTFVSVQGVNWVFYLILYLPWGSYLSVSWFLLPVFFLKGVTAVKPIFYLTLLLLSHVACVLCEVIVRRSCHWAVK